MNMFKRAEAAGPHSIAFKPTLRWHRGSSNPAEPTMSVSSKIRCTYMCSLRCGTANYLKRELWILTSMTSQISPHCKMCKRCKGGVPQSCQLLTLWPLDTFEFRESNSFRCIQMHNDCASLVAIKRVPMLMPSAPHQTQGWGTSGLEISWSSGANETRWHKHKDAEPPWLRQCQQVSLWCTFTFELVAFEFTETSNQPACATSTNVNGSAWPCSRTSNFKVLHCVHSKGTLHLWNQNPSAKSPNESLPTNLNWFLFRFFSLSLSFFLHRHLGKSAVKLFRLI